MIKAPIYRDLSKSPYYSVVATCDGELLRLYFSSISRKESFERRRDEYAQQVDSVISSRYHGIRMDAALIAALDLYARVEHNVTRRIAAVYDDPEGDETAVDLDRIVTDIIIKR